MAKENSSLAVLKEAFSAGYEAFQTVVQNEKGVYNNPHNTYTKGSLPYKEWQRGYDWAFSEQQRKVNYAR